jgi:hypothetical protein
MNKFFLALISAFVYIAAAANINAQVPIPNTSNSPTANIQSEDGNFKKSNNKSEEIRIRKDGRISKIESNPACQNIINECKKLGFIVGDRKQDNGLWIDCFKPILSGKAVTQKGKTIAVSVSASDITACKEVTHKNDGEYKQNRNLDSKVKSDTTSPAIKK